MRPLRVFLCHSSNDKPAVRELYQKLRAETWINPWLDEEELYPGQDWNMEIEKAVEAADAIIVCLTKNSINKEGYVQRELRIVLDFADYKPEGTLYIIPVRLDECDPPRRLRAWQYEDYFGDKRERALQRLLVSLKRRADSLGLKLEKPAPKKEEKPVKKKEPTVKELKTEQAIDEVQPIKPVVIPKQTFSNGMEFMRVPAGKFLMGSKDSNKPAYGNEYPQHSIDIAYDYWMARYPVTNELYNAYLKAKGGEHPVDGWEKKKDHPVLYVDWNDAMAYCGWLNGQIQNYEFEILNDENLQSLIVNRKLAIRLPTEAEWEKAARGTDGREYPWGNAFDKNKCNTSEGGKGDTASVGNYSPQGDSPYDCADMSGNVWEWTHSLFKSYPYKVNDGRESEKASGNRVLRGGSFINYDRDARCASRIVNDILDYRGFRVAASPVLF